MFRSRTSKIILGIITIPTAIVFLLGLILSLNKTIDYRHQPYQFNESVDYNTASFEEYINYSKRLLTAAQLLPPSQNMLNNAAPFILEPGEECSVSEEGKYQNGIVLTHGLVASPYSMIEIGEYFQSRCFYVLGVLLPGHATRPGDILKVTWQDFANIQSFATNALQQKVENVFLSGHSLGGTIAINEALINTEVDGLILFAPALGITSSSKYARWPALLGKFFSKAAWYDINNDDAIYRYESFSFSAAQETYELIEHTQLQLEETPLTIPVLSITSMEDNTVFSQATLDFMEQQSHPLNHTVLYSQKELSVPEAVTLISSNDLSIEVMSLSHLGIMVSPAHPFYGRDGLYRSCKHYLSQPDDLLQKCLKGERDYYGEATRENMEKGVIERIAFNPFYQSMTQEIDRFLESIK